MKPVSRPSGSAVQAIGLELIGWTQSSLIEQAIGLELIVRTQSALIEQGIGLELIGELTLIEQAIGWTLELALIEQAIALDGPGQVASSALQMIGWLSMIGLPSATT